MIGSRRTTAAQRIAAVVVGLVTVLPLAGVALVSGAAPASASTYRYWTYWWGTDTGKPHSGWKFASQGPASSEVKRDDCFMRRSISSRLAQARVAKSPAVSPRL